MSEIISRPFTFVKDGVFYSSRRIPKELRDHHITSDYVFAANKVAKDLRCLLQVDLL